MLKNISSVISPDLLWLLASMGHGEDLVLVDRNFPAMEVAKRTSTGRLIELAGLNLPQAEEGQGFDSPGRSSFPNFN